MKRIGVLLLAAALLPALSACRIRTTTIAQPTPVVTADIEREQAAPDDTKTPEPAQDIENQTAEVVTSEPPPEADAPTQEDQSSQRRAYSSEADAELAPGAEVPLLVAQVETQPNVPSAPAPTDGGATDENRETENAEQTATETLPADVAENTGASQDAPAADTVLLYYQTLLDDRLGSLFECERLDVYWETSADYTTVYKTSVEHRLILEAGAYDVSGKLMESNLTVDDGWVERKNPGLAVKVVSADILGRGVQTTASAAAVREALLARAGWAELDAARSGRVLILSEDLLATQAGRTAASVYLAKAMYPALFEDVDADEVLRLLLEEAAGSAVSGTFVFEG